MLEIKEYQILSLIQSSISQVSGPEQAPVIINQAMAWAWFYLEIPRDHVNRNGGGACVVLEGTGEEALREEKPRDPEHLGRE